MKIGLNKLKDQIKKWDKSFPLSIKFEIIKDEIKYAIQRAWIGYDEKYAHSIDIQFCILHKAVLYDFKQNARTAPSGLIIEEWISILDEMINLLINIEKNIEYENDDKKLEKDKKRFFHLFVKYFNHLWN